MEVESNFAVTKAVAPPVRKLSPVIYILPLSTAIPVLIPASPALKIADDIRARFVILLPVYSPSGFGSPQLSPSHTHCRMRPAQYFLRWRRRKDRLGTEDKVIVVLPSQSRCLRPGRHVNAGGAPPRPYGRRLKWRRLLRFQIGRLIMMLCWAKRSPPHWNYIQRPYPIHIPAVKLAPPACRSCR